MMEEELQQMKEASQSDPSTAIQAPQRPPRHKKWKAARMKGDKYINEDVATVASKIDSLKQQSSQGSFTPYTADILSTAIGKPDYPDLRSRGDEGIDGNPTEDIKTCLPMASRRIESLSMQKSRVDRSGLNRRAINNQGAPIPSYLTKKLDTPVVGKTKMPRNIIDVTAEQPRQVPPRGGRRGVHHARPSVLSQVSDSCNDIPHHWLGHMDGREYLKILSHPELTPLEFRLRAPALSSPTFLPRGTFPSSLVGLTRLLKLNSPTESTLK
ncbi:hypothetical protein K1719_018022 [Acacia pycnantha]|nr:hypothetical protein K1719_018022 [Acacia pycnantha]